MKIFATIFVINIRIANGSRRTEHYVELIYTYWSVKYVSLVEWDELQAENGQRP